MFAVIAIAYKWTYLWICITVYSTSLYFRRCKPNSWMQTNFQRTESYKYNQPGNKNSLQPLSAKSSCSRRYSQQVHGHHTDKWMWGQHVGVLFRSNEAICSQLVKTVTYLCSRIGAVNSNENSIQTLIEGSDAWTQVDSKHSPGMNYQYFQIDLKFQQGLTGE